MVSRLEDGFQYTVETMCFDTGAQALLVYAETHNQYMIGGGNKADVQVLGAAKGSGFGCDRRGTIVFAAMDTDDQIPGYNPTPVQAEFITCARDQLTKQLGGYEQFYALKWNANLRAPGEGQSKLWRKMKHAVPGIMRLGGREQEVIPLRRDNVQGCFCIDYIPLVSASKDHQLLLNRVFLDRQDERSKANVEASWLHMMPADVADKAEAAIDLATEGMGSNSELYPFSPVFTENHENSQNINYILGTPMVDPKIS
jgi:hypothetical protein